jgi:hypothetical protein
MAEGGWGGKLAALAFDRGMDLAGMTPTQNALRQDQFRNGSCCYFQRVVLCL